LQRCVDQDPPEIAMVIRLWRGRPADPTARFAGGSRGWGFGGGTPLVNVSTDHTD